MRVQYRQRSAFALLVVVLLVLLVTTAAATFAHAQQVEEAVVAVAIDDVDSQMNQAAAAAAESTAGSSQMQQQSSSASASSSSSEMPHSSASDSVDSTSRVVCPDLVDSNVLTFGESTLCFVECRLNGELADATFSPFLFCSQLTSDASAATADSDRYCIAGSDVPPVAVPSSASNSSSSSNSSNSTSPSSSSSGYLYGRISNWQLVNDSRFWFAYDAPLEGAGSLLVVKYGDTHIANSPILIRLHAPSPSSSSSNSENPIGSAFAVGGAGFFAVVALGGALLFVIAVWLLCSARACKHHRTLQERRERDRMWLGWLGTSDLRTPFYEQQ